MLGSTVPVRGGIHNCFIYGDLWGCECIQIYSTLSRRWNIPRFPNQDTVIKYKSALKPSCVKMVISHIPFLVNLCAQDKDLQQKSRDRLQIELIYNNAFGIPYTVLHPGSNPDKRSAINIIADNLNSIINELGPENQCTILLETMSGQGNYLGNLDEISDIIALIEHKNRIGVCLDTAHVYQNGLDINSSYTASIQTIDNIIGLKNIKALHMNDSLTALGSHVDRHAFIGEGYIKIETFEKLINNPAFINLPKLLELPDISKSPEALDILKMLRRS